MTEHELQSAIIQLIQVRGGLVIRTNSGFIRLEDANGKSRVFKGASKGTSDLIALYKGHFLAIEVKAGRNRATFEQEDFIQQVRDRGGIAFVTWSADTVISALDAIDGEAAHGR